MPLENPASPCYTVNCRKSEKQNIEIPGFFFVKRPGYFYAQKPEVNRDMLLPDYRLEPPEAEEFILRCPVCGKECDTVYLDLDGDVAGCEHCITLKDAYEYLYE